MDSNLLRSCSAKIAGAFLITFIFCGAMELEAADGQDPIVIEQLACCYPSTGNPPSDFSIHGLWPNYNDGRYPSNWDSTIPFDSLQISDLIKEMNGKWASLACPSNNSMTFWEHEWEKHDSFSETVLQQHDYFAAALCLKDSVDLLGALEKAGIRPSGEYSLSSIEDVVQAGTGYSARIECNTDESGKGQLYQIYLCVDSSASNFISSSLLPSSKCSSQVFFPSF